MIMTKENQRVPRRVEQLVDAAERAVPIVVTELGRFLLRQLPEATTALKKGDHRRDFYTVLDRKAEAFLRDELKPRFERIGFLGEEFNPEAAKLGDVYWVMDALDGTLNMSKRMPHFAISIALVYRDYTLYGCIYDPSMRELFSCRRGRGVYLGDIKLPQLGPTTLAEELVSMGHGYDDAKARVAMRVAEDLQGRVRGVRQTGCASLDLAYVAAARFGAFFHPYLKRWDRSAGELMAVEVGARVDAITELATHNTQALVVSNPWIHDEVCKPFEKHARMAER